MKRKLTGIFFNYFYGKADYLKFEEALYTLSQLEQEIELDENLLNRFVENYFQMKGWIEVTHDRIYAYLNSVEGKGESLIRRFSLYKNMKNLERLYKKCDVFEGKFFDKHHVSMQCAHDDLAKKLDEMDDIK